MNNSQISSHKAKILVLGTFHMGSTPDLFSVEIENHLTDKRQEEILEVIERINAFKPTRIAVEMEQRNTDSINEKYRRFLSGEYELESSEVYQLGFRIAASNQLEEINCVDWMGQGGEKGVGEVYEWASENQPELFNSLFGWLQQNPLSNKPNEYRSILDMYRNCNDLDFLERNHMMNINISRIKSTEEYIGMDWLSWWYKRNLIMYANLAELAASSDERILFIVGGAHVQILSNFLAEGGLFELEKTQPYL
ncbi:DUF5694 domain-containing protein [Paenibacillus glycanilyticus]|uniref:DUF5694 domain-containing protein n=1 Tax=Paenibacillus glycanilyticus TaxID=126569 RepID=UPI00203D84C5|nr:DUF5694 domain-containing protein [Paenibacillus glycanilyticus]MCM3628345.1 DUF5694 domain-containing protein [Paenibacillus glycanilyticus]